MGIDQDTWKKLSEELEAKESGGIWLFPKVGETYIRIVPLLGTEKDERPAFWIDTVGAWQSKPNKRRILLAIVKATPGRTILDEDKNKVIPLIVAPTVVSQIVKVLAAGFDLFGATTGHALKIARTGEGRGTSYRVDASPAPVALPDTVRYLDMNLNQLDAHYRETNGVDATGQVVSVPAESNTAVEQPASAVEPDNSW